MSLESKNFGQFSDAPRMVHLGQQRETHVIVEDILIKLV